MNTLAQLHVKSNAKMGFYNGKTVPSSYHPAEIEYKAVRNNVLMVDYSHMAMVSVTGDDAWSLLNYMTSADVSIIRDEQAMYSLVLNEDGSICADVYVLCNDDGYYILSENISSGDIITRLNHLLENADDLDIQQPPEIRSMDDDNWGAILLEGPYAWEILAEIYGFDIIGLPYHEYMHTDDGLMALRCGKHGEFAYLLIGESAPLSALWLQLLENGEKFCLKTGGLDYQKTVRIENPCWAPSVYAGYSLNPVELQMQWAIQYDKEAFVGKSAVEELSSKGAQRKLVGIVPVGECSGVISGDKVRVDGIEVGIIAAAVYSPGRHSFIALAMIDVEYAYADIKGFTIATHHGLVAAETQSVPFIYNFSMLVNPTEHSYIDTSKPTRAM